MKSRVKNVVFVATKSMADRLEVILYDYEFPVCSIHGDKTQVCHEQGESSLA